MGQDRLRRTTIMIDQRHTEITHEDQRATIQPRRPVPRRCRYFNEAPIATTQRRI